jgi:hypothetical protein
MLFFDIKPYLEFAVKFLGVLGTFSFVNAETGIVVLAVFLLLSIIKDLKGKG